LLRQKCYGSDSISAKFDNSREPTVQKLFGSVTRFFNTGSLINCRYNKLFLFRDGEAKPTVPDPEPEPKPEPAPEVVKKKSKKVPLTF
jgi:hypothetical protein